MRLLIVYFEKIRVFKAGELALNTLAWDNGTRQETCFVGLKKGKVKREGGVKTFFFFFIFLLSLK